jgi:hypothetical protein
MVVVLLVLVQTRARWTTQPGSKKRKTVCAEPSVSMSHDATAPACITTSRGAVHGAARVGPYSEKFCAGQLGRKARRIARNHSRHSPHTSTEHSTHGAAPARQRSSRRDILKFLGLAASRQSAGRACSLHTQWGVPTVPRFLRRAGGTGSDTISHTAVLTLPPPLPS